MNDGTPVSKQCRICGYPLDSKNRTGLCSNRTEACRMARRRLQAEEKPGKFRVAIKAGDTFGMWVALEDYDHTAPYVLCRCTCGTEKRVHGTSLVNDRSHGCLSCVQKHRKRPAKEPYLKAGATFGRLTLLEDVTYAHDRPRWLCEDGNVTEAVASAVKSGHIRSCGCLHRELMTKHGLTGNPLYQIWKGIIGRCTDPGNPAYENYGGRGIGILDRWRKDVAVFIADVEREIGPRPEGVSAAGRALYSLDRWPDNDGDYEPGNIRWGTAEEQVANQRKVSTLTRDVLRLTKERDALAARVVELEALQSAGAF